MAQKETSTTCPKCKSPASYEKDTLDTFFDSSFYFLHLPQPYISAYNTIGPVDLYIGGPEHATLHLLYARFVTKVLFDRGLLQFEEPFKEILVSGIVKATTFKNSDGEYTAEGSIKTVEKMSKSKGNGVDPSGLVEKYGESVVRLFVLGRCHPTVDWEYDEWGIQGPMRFVERLEQVCDYVFGEEIGNGGGEDVLDERTGVMVSKVQKEMDSLSIHNVVTILYTYLKAFDKFLKDFDITMESRHRNLKKFLVVCYPFLDKVVADIWHKYFPNEKMVWPKAGTRKLTEWKVYVNNHELELKGDRMDIDNVFKEINYKYPKEVREKMTVNRLTRVVSIVA